MLEWKHEKCATYFYAQVFNSQMKCMFHNVITVPYGVKSSHTIWICQVVLRYYPAQLQM
jgi:hypothetical protein